MRVLVADDDTPIRMILRANLEAWGYDVVEAADGEAAWAVLEEEEPPHLAILDWMMPGLDGLEICRRLEAGDRPFVYRILLTSRTGREDHLLALRSGAHDFQVKPVDVDELRCRVLVGERLVRADQNLRQAIADRERAEAAMVHSERMAAVGTLAAGVAHEYNNALAGITGFLDLVLHQAELDGRNRNRLKEVRKAADRIVSITGSLLTFARQESPERAVARLKGVIDDALALVRRDLETHGIDLSVHSAGEVYVRMNPNEIGQVLVNLVLNAQHALLGCDEQRIAIEIGVEDDGETAAFRVSDTGCGIPEEDRGRIFLPFFSRKGEHAPAGSPLVAVKGTGLGLSVAERIVRNHGGSMAVASRVGEGTEVTVRLPLERHAGEGAEDSAAPRSIRAGKGRIVVVDDEPVICAILQDHLTEWGYTVETTDDGGEALARCKAEPVDLVLADLQMRKMAGSDLLRRLQELPPEGRPGCLVITGRADRGDAEIPRDVPILGVVAKPFDFPLLAHTLAEAVAARRVAVAGKA